ncbi:general substrate transporter [Phakopsora pachyrhizi]|uniref:General substrate transporter n=1 Tax=Phakopsora pachyrhizi TaxID=170000 RepID=A0AAV0B1W3_PHAPC|nr:general substrate transporter [Phakopsora pachyrhizi]CAH7676241.1 general substrate transporter [Phakopsora pachyrhizi]
MGEKLRGRLLILSISTLTALSFMLIGYDNGVIGGLTNAPSWNRVFDNPKGDALSTIVAIYEIGCFAGALLAFVVGESLGRKRTIRMGSVWMVAGCLLQTFAFGRIQMIVGRIISGIGMGAINSTAPVLQAEVSPKASRGRYACAQLSTLNFGIFLSYWIDYGMTKHFTSSIAFRFPIGFQLVLIIPIFMLTFWVPESPRWLMFHNRSSEALDIVARLEDKFDTQDIDLQTKFKEIEANVLYEKSIQVKGFKEMFRADGSSTRRRLLIACSVQFFQQLGGINGIIYYANFIFSNSVGFSPELASLMSGFLFTWFFVASFIPWFLIDSIGRRKLLIGSVLIMGCIFAVLAGMIKQVEEHPDSSFVYGVIAAVLCFLYFAAFTTGFQATVWVYPPEILPLRIRSKGTALATASNWIINFAVVEIFPPAVEQIGWKIYLIFMCFNFSFVPVMYFFYPETKGKSLEEIDQLFGDGISADIRHQSISQYKSSSNGGDAIRTLSQERSSLEAGNPSYLNQNGLLLNDSDEFKSV